MPSTYSTDLRIELIANGEQSGTWGTTTNNNLGTLIEDAISGLVSVTTTSINQALTAQNGSVDQARCAAVQLDTVVNAPYNVYVPPVTKLYVIINANLFHAATIYCSTALGNTTAAGAGVTVPAGKSMLLRTDGVNVISSVDYIPSLQLGAALPVASGGTNQTSYTTGDLLYASGSTTLSKLADVATGNALISGGVGAAPAYGKIGLTTHVDGTLPVANGGTGVTTSTGTGANVLSNSPTLITPNLGTPSALVLTNATGLSLYTGVTGVLGVENGGTGTNTGNIVTNLQTEVTGTLQVANGGTGVTSSTGSGAVVLSNSPTLTTPILGTPTSGNLVNCTFPSTISANISGTAGGLSTTLAATAGGTGQTSYAVGDILFANTGTTLSKLADVATGNALISGGVGVAPSYGKIGLTTHVTGTLPVLNGGTGTTTSTGSGANVLATSPTLVTPALGTPSSGNLANCTFPSTLSVNINGTVGATTPNTGAFTTLSAQAGSAAAPAITTSGDTNTGIFFPAADTACVSTGGTERTRVDSTGNVLFGTTGIPNGTSIFGSGFEVATNNKMVLRQAASTTASQSMQTYHNGNGTVGSITISGSATAFNTSSDYRLKENIQPMTGALAKVAALKPCTYTWKVDGAAGEGFIAHELAEVAPQCVTGEKDAVDENGKPIYQGIDVSFLVATLTAAIQELKAELDATKAEIAALKS